MMVVVVDPVLEPGWRSGRLDAPDEPLPGQHAERVVHRLQRDGADFGSHRLRNRVGGDVRMTRDRAQDGEPLRRDLNAMLAKKAGRVGRHAEQIRSNPGVIQNMTPFRGRAARAAAA